MYEYLSKQIFGCHVLESESQQRELERTLDKEQDQRNEVDDTVKGNPKGCHLKTINYLMGGWRLPYLLDGHDGLD